MKFQEISCQEREDGKMSLKKTLKYWESKREEARVEIQLLQCSRKKQVQEVLLHDERMILQYHSSHESDATDDEMDDDMDGEDVDEKMEKETRKSKKMM